MELLTLPTLPNSAFEPLEVTSQATGDYNCIAWAVGETKWNYWPHPDAFFAWPYDIQRTETLASFVQFFRSYGFEPCLTEASEPNFEKTALFALEGIPTHAARQLPEGNWTSKLGILEDVRHSLTAISGGIYGNPVLFFRKGMR